MYSSAIQRHLLAVLLVACVCTSAIRMADWTGDHPVKASDSGQRSGPIDKRATALPAGNTGLNSIAAFKAGRI